MVIAWCSVAAETPAGAAPSIEPIPPGRGLLDPGQVSAMLEGASSTGWQPKGRTLYRVEFFDKSQLWLVDVCADPPNPINRAQHVRLGKLRGWTTDFIPAAGVQHEQAAVSVLDHVRRMKVGIV